MSYKSIDRADAYRLAVLNERAEKIRAQNSILNYQLQEVEAEKQALMFSLGLENHDGSIVTEPGLVYQVGTVLDAQNKPIPLQESPK